MKKNTSLVFVLFLSFSFAFGQGTSEFFSKSDAFFKANVKNGRVDYKTIKENPKTLDDLLEMAMVVPVSKDDAKTYQAFWINSYNLAVIKGLTNMYPLKNVPTTTGFFDKTTYEIGGISTTLNDIENKLLRKNFPKEARFHFVLVCGGLGCPPIINQAYKPSTLNEQLEKQTKLAINNSNFIRVNKNKVKVSQIFEWYPKDFKQDGKNLVDFINKYKAEKLPENAKVSYYPYDWSLNAIK